MSPSNGSNVALTTIRENHLTRLRRPLELKKKQDHCRTPFKELERTISGVSKRQRLRDVDESTLCDEKAEISATNPIPNLACTSISKESCPNFSMQSSSDTPLTPYGAAHFACVRLIQALLAHDYAWVFEDPVDPSLLKIPDYYQLIKNPMDLGTIQRFLSSRKYSLVEEFKSDVLRTFDNALLYNDEGSEVHAMALNLKQKFVLDFDKEFPIVPH